MAEEWLEEIYFHSKYITKLKEIRRICQVNNRPDALYEWGSTSNHLTDLLYSDRCGDDKVKMWIQKLFGLAPQVRDCNGIIDLIESEVLPLMYYLISLYGKIDVSDGERRLLSSKAGYLTICSETDYRYWYSAVDPMEEAFHIAEKIYTPKNTEYHIWGGGLGYLAFQLSSLSKQAVLIHVYEADETMLDYGRHYGVLDWISEDKLILHFDPHAEEFLQNIDEKKKNYYVSRPDMRYRQEKTFDGLKRVYLNCHFWMEEGHFLQNNLASNARNASRLWKDIKRDGFEETMVVAAGPSLDQNLELLKNRKGKLIAVGTVFRKLIKLGIIPDLVVISESDPLVYEQIDGLEKERAPLLLTPHAYWKIAQKYKGDVYFAQMEDTGEGTLFFSDRKDDWFQVGGTVSFFAVEAALKLGARKIELVGLDLAFPAAMSHAEGTPRSVAVSTEGLYEVAGADGGKVYTDDAFDMYRMEIEGLIRMNPQTKFINHSSIGARIDGTIRAEV